MKLRTMKDVSLKGKKIILRVDYNTPMQNGCVSSDYRIKNTYKTINYLLEQNISSLYIVSHMGKPKGMFNSKYSLRPVFDILFLFFESKNLNLTFKNFYEKTLDKYVLFENIRFLDEEENIESENVTKFLLYVDLIADIVVCDAFGVLHRNCTSITIINLPSYAGFLIEREMLIYDQFISNQKTKMDLLILGGKKVSDKIHMIKNLIPKCKKIFIFGGMCIPFLLYNNFEVGKSYCEENLNNIVKEIIELIELYNIELFLPTDFIVKDKEWIQKTILEISKNDIIVDIGINTMEILKKQIDESETIFWNGPPGIFEEKESEKGTKELVELLSRRKNKKIIVGGGDTASAVEKFDEIENFFHVSTGGGSLISLLQGEKLPGLEKLKNTS